MAVILHTWVSTTWFQQGVSVAWVTTGPLPCEAGHQIGCILYYIRVNNIMTWVSANEGTYHHQCNLLGSNRHHVWSQAWGAHPVWWTGVGWSAMMLLDKHKAYKLQVLIDDTCFTCCKIQGHHKRKTKSNISNDVLKHELELDNYKLVVVAINCANKSAVIMFMPMEIRVAL